MLRRVTTGFALAYGMLSTGGYPPVEYPADIRHLEGELEALVKGLHPAGGLPVCPKSHHTNYIPSVQ